MTEKDRPTCCCYVKKCELLRWSDSCSPNTWNSVIAKFSTLPVRKHARLWTATCLAGTPYISFTVTPSYADAWYGTRTVQAGLNCSVLESYTGGGSAVSDTDVSIVIWLSLFPINTKVNEWRNNRKHQVQVYRGRRFMMDQRAATPDEAYYILILL